MEFISVWIIRGDFPIVLGKEIVPRCIFKRNIEQNELTHVYVTSKSIVSDFMIIPRNSVSKADASFNSPNSQAHLSSRTCLHMKISNLKKKS